MRTELVLIKTLRPHPKNSRVHDQENINTIATSLEKFGQQTPLVVGRDNFVIKGCGTMLAMKQIGIRRAEIVRANLSPEDETLFAIADNRTGDLSRFDFATMAEVLKPLRGLVDLNVTGFKEFELAPLFDADWSKPPEGSVDGEGMKNRVVFSKEEWDLLSTISTRCDKPVREVILLACRQYLRYLNKLKGAFNG